MKLEALTPSGLRLTLLIWKAFRERRVGGDFPTRPLPFVPLQASQVGSDSLAATARSQSFLIHLCTHIRDCGQ